MRGATVSALTETQHSSSRLQRAVLQKSAATPQPAAAVGEATKRAPRTRHAKRNKSKLAGAGTRQAHLKLKADVLAFIYRTFFFFGIFNAVLKSYTKLLFIQVVACSRDLCQGMRRISKIGVIFILELLAPKDITGQTLKIMPKICNEQAW